MAVRPLASLSLAVAAVALPVLSTGALAQAYPTKPVRIVATLAPGSAVDILARVIADPMGRTLAQPVIVDNRPGAGGLVATEAVQRAAPDGYTLLLGGASHVINPVILPKVAYDPIRDFSPVLNVASSPNVLIVSNSLPARNVKELVALLKKRKGGLNFGSNGMGTTSHLAGVLFASLTGAEVTHVPYKGAGSVVGALVGGEVDMSFFATVVALPHLKTGRLRALAVTTVKPTALLPQLPTLDSILPGFDTDNWFGMFVAAGMPQAIIDRLNAETLKAMQTPEMRAAFERDGLEPLALGPAEFQRFFLRELDKYAKLVKLSGAKAD